MAWLWFALAAYVLIVGVLVLALCRAAALGDRMLEDAAARRRREP